MTFKDFRQGIMRLPAGIHATQFLSTHEVKQDQERRSQHLGVGSEDERSAMRGGQAHARGSAGAPGEHVVDQLVPDGLFAIVEQGTLGEGHVEAVVACERGR